VQLQGKQAKYQGPGRRLEGEEKENAQLEMNATGKFKKTSRKYP